MTDSTDSNNDSDSHMWPENRDLVKQGELSDTLLTCPISQRKIMARNCLNNLKTRNKKLTGYRLHILLNTVLFSMVEDEIELAISNQNSDLFSLTKDKSYEVLHKHETQPYYLIKNDLGVESYVPINHFLKTEYKTA